ATTHVRCQTRNDACKPLIKGYFLWNRRHSPVPGGGCRAHSAEKRCRRATYLRRVAPRRTASRTRVPAGTQPHGAAAGARRRSAGMFHFRQSPTRRGGGRLPRERARRVLQRALAARTSKSAPMLRPSAKVNSTRAEPPV